MPKALAKPKSASFSSPFLLIRRFCGFRSLQRLRCKQGENAWNQPVKYIVRVAKIQPSEKLKHQALHHVSVYLPVQRVKVLLQVLSKNTFESEKAPKKSLMSCSPGHNVQIQAWVSSQSEGHHEERQCWGASTPAIKSCLNQQFWSESLRPHLKQTNLSQGRTGHPLVVIV